jgi:hypothetical protein
LAQDFRALAANTCARAVEAGDIAAGDLDLALSSLFAAAVSADEERRLCRDAGRDERLARLHRETGRSYFLPGARCRAAAVAP